MRWYQGGISEAVAASRSNGSVFVVYLEGKDGLSQSLTNLLNDTNVCDILETKHFTAIKIETDSLAHQQFSQIYKQATSPSIFFIGKTGSPLKIVTEASSSENFTAILKSVLETHGVDVSTLDTASSTPENIAEVVCEGDTCTIKPKVKTTESEELGKDEPNDDQASSSTSALSPEDKLERAKEIINQKREEKLAEEKEKERLKEIERRQMGKDVQKMKRWQQENELKELVEERNKEKKAEQEAKQRVLAQIAQDRLERATKFAPAPANSPNYRESPASTSQVTHRVVNSNTARLQFKLADGTSHTQEFSNTTTLESVRQYIISNLNLPYSNFTLSTTFPRREFTSENSSDSLANLGLVPNAVILILPLHNGTVSTNSESWFSSLFWSFLAPFFNVFNYLKQKIFGVPRRPNPEGNKRPNASGEAPVPPKRRTPESTYVRKQGNVHRLTDKNDSDDDNNTWNGNSTQQM